MALPLMAAVDSSSSQLRPPPLTQSDAVTSLLSLGLAAAAAANEGPAPIPVRHTTSTSSTDSAASGVSSGTFQTSPSTSLDNRALSTSLGAPTASGAGKHHRRLGSTGKTRRRLSDAREASARPFPQHSLLSLASLSLSTSPGALPSKPLAPRSDSGSNPSGILIAASDASPAQVSITSSPIFQTTVSSTPVHAESEKEVDKTTSGGSTPIPISTNGKQKKRGVDYKCESCAKIYRHPNCLNKHRWEHTRQWREASKFVLSKHQQVQLLEAAAILSFMGANSTSLPEDRSEWPSFLSGGSLPKVGSTTSSSSKAATSAAAGLHDVSSTASDGSTTTSPYALRPHPVPLSTSVPARMSAHSHGPRMHDFTLPPSSTIGVPGPSSRSVAAEQAQQWRPAPGLVGIHTPTNGNAKKMPFVHPSNPNGQVLGTETGVIGIGDETIHQSGWTSHIPSSSVRSESSVSAGSGLRSRSGSRSNSRSDGSELEPDMDDEDVDVEVMDADMAEDDEHEKLVARDTTKKMYRAAMSAPVPEHNGPHPTVYNVAHPYGSYGSYRRSGHGSYGSSGTATAGSLGSLSGYSSHGNSNATESVGYGSYGHLHRNSFASRARRGSIGMKGLNNNKAEDDDDMGVAVKEEDEDDDQDPARKWNGMEMEVDMDMD